jgi:hypothetical protein
LYDIKKMRGYWKLKEEALDPTLWWTRFGSGCGPVIRQTTEWMDTEWRSYTSYRTASVTERVRVMCTDTRRDLCRVYLLMTPFQRGKVEESGSRLDTAYLTNFTDRIPALEANNSLR